jgi:hypothetical protein
VARWAPWSVGVADGLLALGWDVEKSGRDEVRGFEYLEVALGGVVAFGAVDDGLAGGVPGDFLEGEGMAQQVLGKALATGFVVGGDGLFAAVMDGESGVFPGKEVGEFLGLMSLGSRRAWRKRWRKSSMAGARSSAGMQWKRPSGVKSPSAARTWR